MVYKQQRVVRRLPSGDYSQEAILNLIQICIRLHEECKLKFIADIQNQHFFVQNVDSHDPVSIGNHVANSFVWVIEIHGDDGKYLNVLDIKELKNTDIPHRITKITISNKSIYELTTSKLPSIHFELVIDFNTVKIFDLITSPSRYTDNESSFEVAGINSVTVLGVASELEGYFKKHSNMNYIVNLENAYDIFLWFAFLPLSLYLLFQFHDFMPERILASPMPLQIAFSIIIFFQVLLMFRFLFNSTRWFFPCQELTTQTSKKRVVAKYIFSAGLTGILGTIAFNFFSWLLGKLF